MTRCAHPECTTEIRDHELACRPHWNVLPIPLRNRIWRYWKSGNKTAHARAVRDAIGEWAGPLAPARRRCGSCRQPCDTIDATTGRGLCLTCARAGLDLTADVTFTCSRCRRDTPVLVSVDNNPQVCLDCAEAAAHQLERTAP